MNADQRPKASRDAIEGYACNQFPFRSEGRAIVDWIAAAEDVTVEGKLPKGSDRVWPEAEAGSFGPQFRLPLQHSHGEATARKCMSCRNAGDTGANDDGPRRRRVEHASVFYGHRGLSSAVGEAASVLPAQVGAEEEGEQVGKHFRQVLLFLRFDLLDDQRDHSSKQ